MTSRTPCLLLVAALIACGSEMPAVGLESGRAEPEATLQPAAKLSVAVDGIELPTPITLRLPPRTACGDVSCNPKVGDPSARYNMSDADAVLGWIEGLARRESVDLTATVLPEPGGDVRRVLHEDLLITRVALGRVFAVSWRPQAVKDPGGPPVIGGVHREPVTLVARYGALKEYPVLSTSPLVIRPEVVETQDQDSGLPVLSYGGIEFADLRFAIGAAGYKSAAELAARIRADGAVTEDEYSDAEVAMVGTAGVVAELRLSVAPICVALAEDGQTVSITLVIRSVLLKAGGREAAIGATKVVLRPCP